MLILQKKMNSMEEEGKLGNYILYNNSILRKGFIIIIYLDRLIIEWRIITLAIRVFLIRKRKLIGRELLDMFWKSSRSCVFTLQTWWYLLIMCRGLNKAGWIKTTMLFMSWANKIRFKSRKRIIEQIGS